MVNWSCAVKELEIGGCALSGDTGIRHRPARKYHQPCTATKKMGRTVCYYTEQFNVRLNLHCAGIIRSRDTPTMFSYFRPHPTHSHASVGPRPTSGESTWGLWGRKYSLGHIFSLRILVFSCQSSLHQYSLFIYVPTGGGWWWWWHRLATHTSTTGPQSYPTMGIQEKFILI